MIDKLIQTLSVVKSILIYCNDKKEIDFSENDYYTYFGQDISFDELDELLHKLCKEGYFSYTSGGEDGFATSCFLTISEENKIKIKEYFDTILNDINNAYLNIYKEKETILSFSPKNIEIQIQSARSEITNIKKNIAQTELLKSLEPTIDMLSEYLSRIDSVNKIYDSIHIHIINPIKMEGKKGIKSTRNWAIFSIVITTLISFYLANFNFFKNPEFNRNNTISMIDSKLNEIKTNMDIIIRYETGLDEKYTTKDKYLILNRFEASELLRSKNHTIEVEFHLLREVEQKEKIIPYVGLLFYQNKKRIGQSSLERFIKIGNRSGGACLYESMVLLSEGDNITVNNTNCFEVERIFRTESKILPIADSINAVVLKKL